MATPEKAGPMTRADIAGAVAAKMSVTMKQADEMVREYEAAIVRALVSGQEVRLNGFGVFKLQHREARMARNPRTGEQQPVDAKTVPKFQPSKTMKDALIKVEETKPKAAAKAKAPAKPAAKAKAPAKAKKAK